MTKWLSGWFNQSSVLSGDPTRRAKTDVHLQCSDTGQEIKAEALARGWHLLDTGTHYVLIPTGQMAVVC
ncbi:hypothetical protein DBR42_22445 [Pelomonas sp. HMWF004]|nr:hypothetical protein DBR42_22445 [Pelomonas sp. HMWF004]